ncbi:MAG: hypothetical protein IPP66_04285 [Anaerolineales bacterium]|nr:hypothetical protein [Anaerolineales bacterium]
MNAIISIPNPEISRRRWSTWILLAGLLGVGNFLIGWWSLLPPGKGYTVYFWLVEFYSYVIIPTLILFPVSIIIVALWFAHLPKRLWSQITITIIGLIVALVCFVIALSGMWLSTLRIVGHVQQNDQVYYLVKYYDDRASNYAFCVADKFGFAGQCRYIGWKGDDDDPEIYIDRNTSLITVESKNPSFTWMNSFPPSCTNGPDESDGSEYPVYVGGCTP